MGQLHSRAWKDDFKRVTLWDSAKGQGSWYSKDKDLEVRFRYSKDKDLEVRLRWSSQGQ